MSRKIKAIICIFISVFLIAGIIGARYIRKERKAEENTYVYAAKNVAFELGEYIETGDEEHFNRAAADVIQMSNMTASAKDIVNDNNEKIIRNLADVMRFNEKKFKNEAQRLKDAFTIIGENSKDLDYAYAQIQIAITNCGL